MIYYTIVTYYIQGNAPSTLTPIAQPYPLVALCKLVKRHWKTELFKNIVLSVLSIFHNSEFEEMQF